MKEFKQKVTPHEFSQIVDDTINMIEDAFQRVENSEVYEAHIKNSSLSHEEWSDIITNKPAGYIFKDNLIWYIKTADNQVESLRDYHKRLESAAISWMKKSNNHKALFEASEAALKTLENPSFIGYAKLAIKALFRRKK